MASRGGSKSARVGRTRARGSPPQRQPTPISRRAQALLSRAPFKLFVAHPNASAALLFGLYILVYLWPVLLGGKIFSALSVLYNVAPWQHLKPNDIAGYDNYLLADFPLADYPWREFARELIRHGTFPAWNPYILSGVPFFSNPQTGIFSPFNLPLWILPLNYGFGLSAALKLWAGGFGTYLLVRELRLSFLPGLLAGVSFALCSLNVMWLMNETLPGVAVMLPWMVWQVERIFRRGKVGNALALAVLTAVALGGGHPGTQVHTMAAVGLYVLMRTVLLKDAAIRERLRLLTLAASGLVLGTMLMAVMLLPEILSSHDTVGTLARRSGGTTLPGSKMPFGTIRTVLFPDWWGRPSAFETITSPKNTIDLNYGERTFYAGVVAFLLACIGLISRGDWPRKVPFAVLGFLGLAIPLHFPGLYWIVVHLPVFELVQNQRMHFVFEFAVAVLAAFGMQAVLDRSKTERRQLLVPLVAVGVGVIALGNAKANPGDAGRVVRHFFVGANYERTGVVTLTSTVWYLLFAVGLGVALLALRRRPGWATVVSVAILLLAVSDMLHFANGYDPMGPAAKAIPPRTSAIAYLQRHKHDGRIIGLGLALPPDWSMHYGLYDIRGYDPPYPTDRYFRLWLLGNSDQSNWKPLTIGALSPAAIRLLSVLGARYIITEPGVTTTADDDPLTRPLKQVYAGLEATIILNPNAVPRALVAPKVRVAADPIAARAAVIRSGADPSRVVVVDPNEAEARALAGAPPVRGTVNITREDNTHVELHAHLAHRGLVVLNDSFTSGWSARVDGHAGQELHANGVMRGVIVPEGNHRIVWTYRVPGLVIGLLSSLAALVVLVITALVRARRRPL